MMRVPFVPQGRAGSFNGTFGFEAVGFEAVGFGLGYTCVTHQRSHSKRGP